MNNSWGDDVHHNSSKNVPLSRSVVLTGDSSIPRRLILGKLLLTVPGAAAPDLGSLRTRLLQDWAPSGTVNFWRVADGAFLLQFDRAADLGRAMDGAPWSCGGGHLLLLQKVNQEANLVDQLVGAGFATADLWVRFHRVPVDYISAASLCALATFVGVPVALPDPGAATPVDGLRARIRVDVTRPLVCSIPVDLDDGRRELVRVVYEKLPSLCTACGVIGHPPDRCPGKRNQHEAAPTTAASRLRRGKPAGSYVLGRLGSRRASSCREADNDMDQDHSGKSCGRAGGSPAPRPPQQPEETSADGTGHLLRMGAPPHQRPVSATCCLPCNNLLELISLATKKKRLPGEKDHVGVNNLQDMRRNQTVLLTFSSQQSAQDSLVMAEEETSPDSSLAIRTLSSFQFDRGYVNYYLYSGSRKNPRIEVMVETQCSPQLMNKAMEWLSENTGLKASYDGKRGVISIIGLQIDQRMGPVDLVAYLYPETRQKTGVAEAQKKLDSPARLKKTIIRLYDVNRCKGASCSRDTERSDAYNSTSSTRPSKSAPRSY